MLEQVVFNRSEKIEICPNCPKCNGCNIKKLGRYVKSDIPKQQWQCKDCRKIFLGKDYVFQTSNYAFDVNNPNCVNCGSTNLIKRGHYLNKQRHHCKDCKKEFLAGEYGTFKGKTISFDPNNPKCNKCGGVNLNKVGPCPKTNKQRYKCKDCGKRIQGALYKNKKTPLVFAGIKCPHCPSRNIKLNGKCAYTKKQKFFCNNCGKGFQDSLIHSASNHLSKDTTLTEMFELDIWDARLLGLDTATNGCYTLNFCAITPAWLKTACKHFIKYKSGTYAASTIINKIKSIRIFSNFLKENHPNLLPQEINRNLVSNYLLYLSRFGGSSKFHSIGNLKQFLEGCARHEWADVTKEQLFFEDDIPNQITKLPRYIPDQTIKEIEYKLESLAEPVACAFRVSTLR